MEQATEATNAIPRFIISHGDKGGVGKSTTSRAIVDYFFSLGLPVAVLEADTRNPDVERMFNTYVPCARVDLREESGWMSVVDFVAAHPGHTFVLNTPAGIGEYIKLHLPMLHSFLNEDDVPVAELEMWWTLDIVPDSLSLFTLAHDDYGQLFTRIRMVRNLFRGDEKAFFLFNESSLPRQIVKNGGQILNLPALHLRVINKIYDPKKPIMPFSIAIDAALGEKLELQVSERRCLIDWRDKIATCLEPAFVTETATAGGKNK